MASLSLIRTKKISLIITVLSLVFIGSTFGQFINKTCFSPDQYPGRCVELEMCENVAMLRHKSQQTHMNRLYVSLSQCGSKNNKPLVCCTQSPFPDGQMNDRNQNIFQTTISPLQKITNLEVKSFQCAGILDNRIFGGSETRIDEMPFTALLAYSKSGIGFGPQKAGFYCGGALISKNAVITAAHCTHEEILTSKNWQLKGVRLGEWDLGRNPDCETSFNGKNVCAPPVLDLAISNIIVHEGYVPFDLRLQNDISILKLQNSVEFNDFVRPICLPLNTEDYKNVEFTVGGFGKTEVSENSKLKLKTDVRWINNFDCASLLGNQKPISSFQMCALGEESKDSCNGDSGQPLIYANTKSNRLELVGIVSYGPSPCGQLNKPGVYTKIGPYLEWIQNQLIV